MRAELVYGHFSGGESETFDNAKLDTLQIGLVRYFMQENQGLPAVVSQGVE